MPKSDHKYIDFSEDHELVHILNKYGLPTNDEEWKKKLKDWGLEAKEYFGKKSSDNLTHDDFYLFIEITKNL